MRDSNLFVRWIQLLLKESTFKLNICNKDGATADEATTYLKLKKLLGQRRRADNLVAGYARRSDAQSVSIRCLIGLIVRYFDFVFDL